MMTSFIVGKYSCTYAKRTCIVHIKLSNCHTWNALLIIFPFCSHFTNMDVFPVNDEQYAFGTFGSNENYSFYCYVRPQGKVGRSKLLSSRVPLRSSRALAVRRVTPLQYMVLGR